MRSSTMYCQCSFSICHYAQNLIIISDLDASQNVPKITLHVQNYVYITQLAKATVNLQKHW